MVNIQPLPLAFRKISRRYWPLHPPVFDDLPTPADIELARELYQALDPDSQYWYRGLRGRLGLPNQSQPKE